MNRQWIKPSITAVLLGAAASVLVVHPSVEGLHLWRSGAVGADEGLLAFMQQTLRQALQPEMTGMILWMALIGGAIGAGVAGLVFLLRRPDRPQWRTDWSAPALRSLITQGEGERLEFKSSLRWDWKQEKPNKSLESVIAKSVCGLMNHRGGILLIGIEDSGQPVGIEADYQTFSRPNWDGFERCLISVVNSRLGTRYCPRIHNRCVMIDGKSIAVVEVEAANQSVFCRDGNVDRYFVRTGNSTRELDVSQAIAHIATRKQAV